MTTKIESEDQITELFDARSDATVSDSERAKSGSMDPISGPPRWYIDNALFTRFLLLLVSLKSSKTCFSIGEVNRFTDSLGKKYGVSFNSLSEMKMLGFIDLEIAALIDEPKDFIFAEFPIGQKEVGSRELDGPDAELHQLCRLNMEWYYIAETLQALSPKGAGYFPVAQGLFFSSKGKRVLEILRERGFYCDGVLELPKIIESGITMVLACFSRIETESIFCASLRSDTDAAQIAQNYAQKSETHSIDWGTLVPTHEFITFEHTRIMGELRVMRSQFKDYRFECIADLVSEVVRGNPRKHFEDTPNSIYIPAIGSQPIEVALNDLKIKPQNYLQLVVDPAKATNKFVASFLESSFGRKCLAASTHGLISRPDWKLLERIAIPIPNLEEQQKATDLHLVMQSVEKAMAEFKRDLSLHPLGNPQLHSTLSSLLEVIGGENEVQRVCRLAREGENKTTEFKQTFHLDVKNGGKNKELHTQCLKTIVAFLNTEGGVLLVGVADSGEIAGIDEEVGKLCKGSRDKFLLDFKNYLKRRIGEPFYPFIDFRIIDVASGTAILCVECQPSDRACYLDGEKFFVRTNPASDELSGPRLVDYVNTRFG